LTIAIVLLDGCVRDETRGTLAVALVICIVTNLVVAGVRLRNKALVSPWHGVTLAVVVAQWLMLFSCFVLGLAIHILFSDFPLRPD